MFLSLLQDLLEEAGPQHLHGNLSVHVLRTLGLAADDNTGREVFDTDRRIGHVDILATGSAGATCLKLKIFWAYIDLYTIRQFRSHLYRGEARVSPFSGIEGGNPDQPVDSLFPGKETIGIRTLDHEGHALDPGFVILEKVENTGFHSVCFGPPEVKPENHLRPILGIEPPRSRVNRENSV